MHQAFTEPLTPAQGIAEPGLIESTLEGLQNALDEAQKKYAKFRNRNLSQAQYDLFCQVGLDYAVRYPDEWQKFYRNNVGERCDYEKLNKLFYKFYKIQQKKLAKRGSWWHNIWV
jgi:hypothetical protein